MIEKRKQMRGQGGFTLIELLIVIAILGVLGGAVILGIGAMRGNAEAAACSVDRAAVETAAEAYYLEHDAYPDMADLVASPYIKRGLSAGDFVLNNGEVTAIGTGATAKYRNVNLTDCA